MNSATSEFTRTLFKSILADQSLVQTLSGPNVFDRVSERIEPPYVVLGRTNTVDWDTSTEAGEAITFTIHCWTASVDRLQNLDIQDHIKRILTAPLIPLENHHIINMRMQFSEVRRDTISGNLQGLMRFRAVTEPKL